MPIMSANARRTVRGLVGPPIIDLLQWSVSRRDWQGVERLGRRLGAFGYQVDRRHRRVAEQSVRLAFGEELDEAGVVRVVRGSFQHLATLFLEALRLPAMGLEEGRRVCAIKGEQHLREALALGRGVIVFSGHLGNWEIGAVRLIQEGYRVVPLSRPPSSPRLARKFKSIRDRLNFPVIPVSEGIRGILRALKDNCIVPIMPDRHAKGQGQTVPFFNRPTHVWHTPALIASRTQSPVVPMHALRGPEGIFTIDIGPAFPMQETADRDYDLWFNTARTMAYLERKVRAHPEQYPWQYRLWRPGDVFPRDIDVAQVVTELGAGHPPAQP